MLPAAIYPPIPPHHNVANVHALVLYTCIYKSLRNTSEKYVGRQVRHPKIQSDVRALVYNCTGTLNY